jgi:ribosomal silencing factor RsfS
MFKPSSRLFRTGHRLTTRWVSSKAPHDVLDEELTEWIPPPPKQFSQQPSDASSNQQPSDSSSSNQQPDWLSTRRHALMDRPNKNRRFASAELDVIPGVLLSEREILQCLGAMGAVDIVKILDDENGRMGGAVGMLFCTASSVQHLHLVTDTLVRQLKVRKLTGVPGAAGGAQGGDGPEESWKVVDCRNYIVHVMLEHTRRSLNLEALWSGEDELLQLKLSDEDAIDDYVARNPVPENYPPRQQNDNNAADTVLNLQRFNAVHRSVVKDGQRPKFKNRNRNRIRVR